MPAEQVLRGADFARTLTLLDRDGEPVTTYTAAATLAAALWPGDGRAPLVAPAASWVDPAEGTVRLALSAAQTAALEPGVYPVRLEVTASGVTSAAVVMAVEVLAAPGSGAEPPSYCSYADMRAAVPWIGDLATAEDQAGFAEQRAQARAACDRMIQRHFRGQRGRRQTTLDHLIDGPDSGRWRDGADDLTLQAWLDDDRLVLTGPSGAALVRWNALVAAAIVCDTQIDNDGKYQDLARRLRTQAREIAASVVAKVDTTDPADGIGDIAIDLGVADTLRS